MPRSSKRGDVESFPCGFGEGAEAFALSFFC